MTDDDPEFANRPDGSLLKDLEPRYLSGRQTFFDVFQRAYEKNTLDQRFKSCIDNPERKQEFLASVDRMVSNVLSLDENNYGGTHVATKVARSEKELKSRDFKEFLVRYTKDVKRPSGPSKKYPILWPFVEVVRWYIGGNHQSSILESGVILLDLPGVTDSNLFRQDVSIAAQRGCDATVIVVNIDRVVNELHTQNLAIKAIEQCQSNTRQELFVVCTRSEITDAIGNVDYDEDTLGHDHTNATEIKDLYDELENELESASPDELKSLQSDRRCLQRKLQELQAIHRNDSVVKKIREKFSEWTAASKYAHLDITPSPKILCVSNTEYNARRTHEDLSSTIFPSISDTGIPRVREELIRSALKARISTLEEHISDKLQIMLYDLGRDCRPTTTKQPMLNHLHKAISTAEEVRIHYASYLL